MVSFCYALATACWSMCWCLSRHSCVSYSCIHFLLFFFDLAYCTHRCSFGFSFLFTKLFVCSTTHYISIYPYIYRLHYTLFAPFCMSNNLTQFVRGFFGSFVLFMLDKVTSVRELLWILEALRAGMIRKSISWNLITVNLCANKKKKTACIIEPLTF